MDLVYLISTFISEHFGLVIGILIIFASISSARKKAKRAQQEYDSEEYQDQRNFDYEETYEERKPPKSFKELMAEIEAELREETEAKPWDIPREPKKAVKQEKPFSPIPEGQSAYPSREPGKAAVKPVTPKVSMPPSVSVPGDLTSSDITKEKVSVKPKAKQNDLVTAVIMSEVLGTPKGLEK